MSDDPRPPSDDDAPVDADTDAAESNAPSFFDDGLEQLPSMHAAADRASLTIARDTDDDEGIPPHLYFPSPSN